MRGRLAGTCGAIALVTLLLAPGCGGSDGAGAAREDARGLSDGAFEQIEGMRQASDQAPLAPEDVVVILRAEERLVAACMAQHGFTYETVMSTYMVPSAPLYLSPSELRRSGYQYDWEAAAERFLALNGPGGPPNPTEGMAPAEAVAYSEALGGPPNAQIVTIDDLDGGSTGQPNEGCAAEARTGLYGSVENSMRFSRALEALSITGIATRLGQIDTYKEPLEQWQECMRQAGFDVHRSMDYGLAYLLSRGARALEGSGTISADVITATASTDADCQESSGLFDVRTELLPDAMDDVTAELGFEMSQYVAFQHAVLERSLQVP